MSHGSLQYWPHRRARRRLPRLRNSPDVEEQGLANIVAYKVGMTHLIMVDDSNSTTKGLEISIPCTLLELPRMEAYGIRLYVLDHNSRYLVSKEEIYNKALAQKLGIKKTKHDESKISTIKPKIKEFVEVSVLVAAQPSGTSAEQHHPMRFEAPATGKTVEEKFEFASKVLGSELRASDLFKAGEYVDMSSITKGKGWQGPIKRFHVKRNFHKGTGKIRHGGPLGAFSPGKVFYTTPRAGQLGFNYRTEHNKRILKLGKKEEVQSVARDGGYKNYGQPQNDFILVEGSVPGVPKRLVRIRKSIRHRNETGIKEPKLVYIAR